MQAMNIDMKRWISFLLALSFSSVMTAGERTIELNVTGQPPLNASDQMSFMDEVTKEALRRIGYNLKTVQLPAERGLVNANKGKVDGEMSRVKGIDKIYNNLVRVPEKIMDWEFVAFSKEGDCSNQGWAALSGKNIAHINGWKIFEKNVPSTAEITKTSNSMELFTLLKKGRADLVLYERWGGHYILNEMGMNNVNRCMPALAVKEMFIYLHKKNKSIVKKLAAALAMMKQDGSYQKLFNQYLLPFQDSPDSKNKSPIN